MKKKYITAATENKFISVIKIIHSMKNIDSNYDQCNVVYSAWSLQMRHGG